MVQNPDCSRANNRTADGGESKHRSLGGSEQRFVRHIGHWIDGFALRRASHVITLTESCARKMRFSYGFTTEQATVIPDAIDLSAFCANLSPIQIEAFRQRFAIPNDRNIVLYLGRIRSEKGWQDLPDVARALGPQGLSF